ncbi:uncharacterized protein LOC128883653 isoform X2 [Hylaeus volcanicus]|uniref:uncharacterized protein LOC128883653 isoform X2 n=1 Tax=Hylaeus volcanicus TaxID=313075 RepID=UPI0023B7B927|nr:uncharacterized protein LOC128883653 isoform X2 [Hylaeus volcanicus]
MAFFLEKFLYPFFFRSFPKVFKILSFFLSSLNAVLVLIVPYYTLGIHNVDPLCGTVLIGCSITWFLKLVSFHHVLYDIRSCIKQKAILQLAAIHKSYPEFLNFFDYYTYLIMPTLCFQFHYPRTNSIRWTSVLRHFGQMFFFFILIKIVIEQYMVVILQNTFVSVDIFKQMSVLHIFLHLSERILNLSVPNLCVWLLMFFILFHHWLNILAEITYFADRDFYGDWWNSSSFDEYWRKWNRPIHNFFARHLHKPLLSKGLSRFVSGQIIFIISALAHEYLVVVPLRLGWTGLVFTGFIAQVPLIYITSKPLFKKYPIIGNALFWVVFCFTGQPLAILFYYYLWGVQHGKVEHVSVSNIHKIRFI